MARPRQKGDDSHIPTEETKELVAKLYAAGIPIDRISTRLDIDAATLRKHYRAQLDECLDSMISGLAGNLFQDAMAGDKKDREFWLKTRGRFAFAKDPEDSKPSNTDALLEKLIDKL